MLGPFGHSGIVVANVDVELFVSRPLKLSELGKGNPWPRGVLEEDGETGDMFGIGVKRLSSAGCLS